MEKYVWQKVRNACTLFRSDHRSFIQRTISFVYKLYICLFVTAFMNDNVYVGRINLD